MIYQANIINLCLSDVSVYQRLSHFKIETVYKSFPGPCLDNIITNWHIYILSRIINYLQIFTSIFLK